MSAPLTLTIESSDNLRPAVVESLALPTPSLTVEELITLRVLHGTATRSPEEQAQAVRGALHAFRQNLYLLVVDNRRVTELDERLTLSETTTVRFWRLLPLVGG